MVDHLRQILAQTIQELVARQAALRGELVDLVGAQRIGEIARRDLLVLSSADPGTGLLAMPGVLQLLEQVIQPARQHRACCGAAKQAAERPLEHITKAATAAKSTTRAAAARD